MMELKFSCCIVSYINNTSHLVLNLLIPLQMLNNHVKGINRILHSNLIICLKLPKPKWLCDQFRLPRLTTPLCQSLTHYVFSPYFLPYITMSFWDWTVVQV